MNINQCSKRIKSKREGITYPLFLIETAKKFRGFLSKRRKRKKSSPSGSSFQVKFIWSSNEAHLILGRMYLKLRRDVSGAASGRICYCVGTHLLLRRDVPDATSGRNFGNSIGDYTGKNSIKNTAKNHQKRLSIAIFMAIYGRLWQLKSYCNIGTFS